MEDQGYESNDLVLAYEPPEELFAGATELKEEGLLEFEPIGRDGLVFLVNEGNPVASLTQDQLRAVYRGDVTDWSALGGAREPVIAFVRNEDSGSHAMFVKCLMHDEAVVDPQTVEVATAMGDLVEGIAEFGNGGGAIGYSVFYYADRMYAAPDVKMLAVDGVVPSNESIADGSYPLTSDFYAAIRADLPEDAPARLVYDWLLTEEGAALLREAGYVPVPAPQ
ncbi:MAG: substrate-binding domain-containing protein [Clostridiales Family XIII bacterium]|nr:substrate-binding domain-containing protein [Clostridiales Family XIII bacterium]